MRYLLIISTLFIGRFYANAQHTPSGYETVDNALTEIGYNILKSFENNIEKPVTEVPIECYGGNKYFITIQFFDKTDENLIITLKNSDGKVYATGNDRLDIDLRFEHGQFPLTLEIKSEKYTEKPRFLLVQAYRSISNATNNYAENKDVKAFYTLDGLTQIENLKGQFVQQIKDYLSAEMKKQGATTTELIVANSGQKDELIPYTFYRENAYLIYGYSSAGELASFKLVKPEEKKVNPFGGDTMVTEEQTLITSSQGMITSNFIGQSPNLFKLGLRSNKLPMHYGGFIVYAIGYRSKDNQTQNASLNKPEKHYVR